MFGGRKHPRLGQWNGRRRSSRSDEPMLPRLWQRPVLFPLGIRLLAALAVRALASWGGPPSPYPLGEPYACAQRARVDVEVVTPVAVANRGDGKADERPLVEKYPAGTLLIQRGLPITDRQLDLLQEEHA